MANIICLFNHKGGVSKTTTAFNLGWMVALKGKRVLLAAPPNNIKDGLAPAFESQPRQMVPVECGTMADRTGGSAAS